MRYHICMGEIFPISGVANLDMWSQEPWTNGIQLDRLNDMQSVAVRTLNNSYEIIVIEGRRGEILVRGGRFFPELTPARLAGATVGSCFCKMRGIYVGFCMEINANRQRIITSQVQSITVMA